MIKKYNERKLMMLVKACLYAAILVTAINVAEARIYVNFGGYGYPGYCEPGYWDDGIWVPGNCGYDEEEYYSPGPSFTFGGFGGGFEHHEHHWHHHH